MSQLRAGQGGLAVEVNPPMADSISWQSKLRQVYHDRTNRHAPMPHEMRNTTADERTEQASPIQSEAELPASEEQETLKFAEYLGMGKDDTHLMWIAESAVKAPLPAGWTQHAADDGTLYFHSAESGESSWEHPQDAFFKELYQQAKKHEETSLRLAEAAMQSLSPNQDPASQADVHASGESNMSGGAVAAWARAGSTHSRERSYRRGADAARVAQLESELRAVRRVLDGALERIEMGVEGSAAAVTRLTRANEPLDHPQHTLCPRPPFAAAGPLSSRSRWQVRTSAARRREWEGTGGREPHGWQREWWAWCAAVAASHGIMLLCAAALLAYDKDPVGALGPILCSPALRAAHRGFAERASTPSRECTRAWWRGRSVAGRAERSRMRAGVFRGQERSDPGGGGRDAAVVTMHLARAAEGCALLAVRQTPLRRPAPVHASSAHRPGCWRGCESGRGESAVAAWLLTPVFVRTN